MHRFGWWFGLLCWVVLPVHAESARVPVQAALSRVHAAQAHLASVKESGGETGSPDVPAAAGAGILALKDALTATVDARLDCEHEATFDIGALQQDLVTNLGADESSGVAPQVDAPIYGSELKLRMERPRNASAWLLVSLSFGIPYGDDNILLGYAFRGGRWTRVLRWQSARYAKISGAFGDFFEYVVIPADDKHRAQLVVAHGMPWPMSRWSGFTVDVIAPNGDPDSARKLFHALAGYSRGDGEPVLKARSDGFDLRLEGGILDVDTLTRLHIYRYREIGGQFRRAQPVALDGRDFVDEWLQEDWPQAAQWSDPAASQELQAAHREVMAAYGKLFSVGYGAVRTCSAGRYQVEVGLHADRSNAAEQVHYFQVRAESDGFTMLSATAASDPACHGGDLMKH